MSWVKGLIVFILFVVFFPGVFAIASVNFSIGTPFSGTLVHSPHLLINVTSLDVSNVTVILYNSSRLEIRRDNASQSPYLFNFSNLASGVYFFNATGFNETADNRTETRNVVMVNPTKVSDGRVKSSFKINTLNFGNGNELSGGAFGNDVAPLGDLNGDGIPDIVIGEIGNDDGGTNKGAIYISFLNESGYVTSFNKINESRLGNGQSIEIKSFGSGVGLLGDIDGDGVQDIAVGESGNNDGVALNGAAWIIFLNTTGGVKNRIKINHTDLRGGLSGDEFGSTLAGIGDLNLDGVPDLAVCDPERDDGGTDYGAVFILFLNTTGGVIDEYIINESRFGNGNELSPSDLFCSSVEAIGDVNDDGVQDIAVGAKKMDDGGTENGAVFILFLNTSGGVVDTYKINESNLGNGNELSGGWFGNSLAPLGDINNDGVEDIAVGELVSADGGTNNGAVWILMLNTSGAPIDYFEINESAFGNGNELGGDAFGSSVNIIGDLDLDGIVDIAVGERLNDDGGTNNGAVWILYLGEDKPTVTIETPTNGTVTTNTEINVNYTVIDANRDTCWHTNGTLLDNETLAGCANITTITWQEGSHTVYVYANNTKGGIGFDVVTFAIDLTAPTWEGNSSNISSLSGAGDAILFNVTLNDTYPGVYVFSWFNTTTWVNDTAVSFTNGGTIEIVKNLTVGTGTIYWLWYFNDTAGNLNQTDTFAFVLGQVATTAAVSSSTSSSSGGGGGSKRSFFRSFIAPRPALLPNENQEYIGKVGDSFKLSNQGQDITVTIVKITTDGIEFSYNDILFTLSDNVRVDIDGDGVDDYLFFRTDVDRFKVENILLEDVNEIDVIPRGSEISPSINDVSSSPKEVKLEKPQSPLYIWVALVAVVLLLLWKIIPRYFD